MNHEDTTNTAIVSIPPTTTTVPHSHAQSPNPHHHENSHTTAIAPATTPTPTAEAESTAVVPVSTTPTTKPNLRQRLADRISSFLSLRKLLRNTRLLILALAFVTLILDAITISFEVNVMGLGLRDVSTQVALLLTPDLFAVCMFSTLLIYSLECFGVSADDDDDYYSHDQDGSYHYDEHTEDKEQEGEESGDDRILSDGRGDRRRPLHDQQDTISSEGSRPRAIFNGNPVPTIAITTASSAHESTPGSQAHPRHRNSISDSASASPLATSPPTIPKEATTSTELEAEATTSTARIRGWRQYRRTLTLYMILRIFFSLVLAVLALYWPAGQFKAPLGRLPIVGGRLNQEIGHHGGTLAALSPRGILLPDNHTIDEKGNTDSLLSPPSPRPHNFLNRHGNSRDASSDPDGNNYGSKRWCGKEESFGDNTSAIVFCRAKEIRPVMTYVWATLVLLELCIAAIAGDFSDSGLYGSKSNYGNLQDDNPSCGSGRDQNDHEQGFPGAQDEEMAVGAGVGRAES
ncbi:hypothetical protein B0O80DRAFT_434221 [Mortierella sp. GBAus27b]|nr:hypothetical protein BGX31_011193 [Mortierella sp. GBA43]KAI8363655.1 hypothetical protein B0O80DRAFT_434221 [Mortierella sp. GBAus27b]